MFRLSGERWTVSSGRVLLTCELQLVLRPDCVQNFPEELQAMTYVKKWDVSRTRIRQLPTFLASFTQLTVLDIPQNAIAELPPDIGEGSPVSARGTSSRSASNQTLPLRRQGN